MFNFGFISVSSHKILRPVKITVNIRYRLKSFYNKRGKETEEEDWWKK